MEDINLIFLLYQELISVHCGQAMQVLLDFITLTLSAPQEICNVTLFLWRKVPQDVCNITTKIFFLDIQQKILNGIDDSITC